MITEHHLKKIENLNTELMEIEGTIAILTDEASQGQQWAMYTSEYDYQVSEITMGKLAEISAIARPFENLQHVVNAILIIFDKPQEYQQFRLLVSRSDFIQMMKHLDIQKLEEIQILRCQEYISQNPGAFEQNTLQRQFSVVNNLAMCCNLIVQMFQFKQQLKPLLEQIECLYKIKQEKDAEIRQLMEMRVQRKIYFYNKLLQDQDQVLPEMSSIEYADLVDHLKEHIDKFFREHLQKQKRSERLMEDLDEELSHKRVELQRHFTRQAQARLSSLVSARPPAEVFLILRGVQLVLNVDQSVLTARRMLKDAELASILLQHDPVNDLSEEQFKSLSELLESNKIKTSNSKGKMQDLGILTQFLISTVQCYELNEKIRRERSEAREVRDKQYVHERVLAILLKKS